MDKSYRLGVDVGGTFTDLTLVDEHDGRVHTLKLPTTPAEPATAILQGIDAICRRGGVPVSSVRQFVHGTTLATNTIIERSGVPTGLLVTKGFRDVLEIGRLRLPSTTNFYGDKAIPLVPRKWVAEIGERLLGDGRVYAKLDPAEVRAAVQRLVGQGIQAIAVCFLHSYKNAEHERQAVALIREEFPQLFASASHEVLSQQREYERALVTVFTAYIGRRMEGYLARLQQGLRDKGLTTKFFVTRSNGGMMTADTAALSAASTLLSGPAAGVIGAAYIGKLAGFERLITLDMGGTSADVAVINREVEFSTENQVGDFPVIMTAVDISSIGAGGGSIAWVDSAQVLKVGPQSAGSEPGPACYGRGGQHPTVTDAYVTLGLIDPSRFLGGEMPLQPDLAHRALTRLGVQLELSPVSTAESILEVTTAKMYAQFSPLMARKGFDPRDFTLLAHGGAGPTHIFMLARELGVRQVIIPPSPGTLCALGGVVADIRSDFVKTVYRNTHETTADQLEGEFLELEKRAKSWFLSEVRGGELTAQHYLLRTADMRYLGQAFEINVALPSKIGDLREVLEAFHARYLAIYGYSDADATVELVNIRSTVVGVVPKPRLSWDRQSYRPGGRKGSTASREIQFDHKPWVARVFDRSDLAPDASFEGPAIVEQYDTTTFVPPGFVVTADRHGNLIGTSV
ncbi:MAG TPA: hydantoinase/oxoprolinase family protein [bacterium]|nr:hydantoinase/oxoprolinase family protein [bacterium]